MKRLTLLTGIVLFLAGVTACGHGLPGQPESGATSTTGASTGGDPASSTTSLAATDVAGMNACSLLTATEAASVGLPVAGYTDNDGAKSGCAWNGTEYGLLVGFGRMSGWPECKPTAARSPTLRSVRTRRNNSSNQRAVACTRSVSTTRPALMWRLARSATPTRRVRSRWPLRSWWRNFVVGTI